MSEVKGSQVINGTHGRIWVDGELWLYVKSFEAKATADIEDINVCGDLATYGKMKGWNGEGTITCYKVDSRISKKIANAMKNGDMPEIKLVGSLSDPSSKGVEKVEILGVMFTEFMLMSFASKEVIEEEIPFRFTDYNFIDLI